MLFANQVENKTSTGKIPFGIHTNCSVTSVAVGDRYIDFNYADAEGRTNNQRIWFPDITKITPQTGETIENALKRVELEAFAHIVKHLNIFLPAEEVNSFSAPDLSTAALKANMLLTPRLGTKKVNLKTIYDKNGEWPVFGKYPDYIEEYVEGKACGLYYSNYEKMHKCTPKKSEVEHTSTTQLY